MSKFIINDGLKKARIIFTVILSFALLGLTVFGQTNLEPDVRPLTIEKPVERELKGGEAHSYTLALQAGQFLNLVVEQKGIDVVVALFDSDNKKIAEVDSPNGTQGAEPLFVIIEQTANYHLKVLSPEKDAPAGRYEVKLNELRAANDTDKNRVAAQNAFSESMKLYIAGTAESVRAALVKFEQARQLYHRIDDKQKEAECFGWAANIYSLLGEKQKALEFYNQALPLFRAVGNKLGEAETINNIAGTYDELSEKQKALEYFNQALLLFRAIGFKLGEAKTLTNSGIVYNLLGESQKALEYFNQALPLFRAVGNKRGEAVTFTSIGLAYTFLGEKQKALESYNQALPILRAIGDKSHEAVALSNIGLVLFDLGEKQKALEYQNQSLLLFRAVGNKRGEATALTGIGLALSDLGEKQKALEYFNQTLLLMRAIGDRNAEASILGNMGVIYEDLGEKQKALETYNQALPLLRASNNRRGEAIILNYLFFHFTSKNPRLGIFYGKQSVNNYQILRSNAQGLDKNIQRSLLKSIEGVYRRLANSLIKQNRLAEAQQILNAFKDQQFFDFNSNKQSAPLALTERETSLAPDFNQKLEAVAGAIRRLADYRRGIGNRPLTTAETDEIKGLENRLQTANDDYQAFLKSAEKQFAAPPDDKDKFPDVPDLTQMQTALRETSAATKQNTVAVYQLVGEENFSAIIITPDSIRSVSIPVKNTVLNEKAKQFWALLQSDKYDATKLGKELYKIVFEPLEKELPKNTKTILWSLDGNLRYVPMAAIFDGKQFLVERYKNVVFTRADSERMTRKVSNVWTGTGFGSSQAATVEFLGEKVSFNALPGVTEELAAIFKNQKGGILNGETFPDAKFSKKNFLEAMKQRRSLVHIASHFSFRPGDEARSFLLMGDGTAFTLEEMKRETNLFQDVELLTLSACDTAAQRAGADGREIDGFAELAQRLGASAVMATLWQVSDASTPWLMRDFYATRESRAGVTKTEALQKAQLGLLYGTAKIKPLPESQKSGSSTDLKIEVVSDGTKIEQNISNRGVEIIQIENKNAPLYKKEIKKPFAHPYYWAPFVLYGNWR